MGDFNARIGYDRRGVEDCLGPFGTCQKRKRMQAARTMQTTRPIYNQHTVPTSTIPYIYLV